MNTKKLEKRKSSELCSSKLDKAFIPEKQGIYGETLKLNCNFTNINSLPGFKVFQYSVEFIPPIDITIDKKYYLLNQHHAIFSSYIFNGVSIYTANELQILKYTSRTKDEKEVILKFTEIKITWPSFQFLNLLFQKVISSLDLQLIKENFYNPSAAIDYPAGELELWPGYIVLIQEFEKREILLCCELSYKIIRRETIYSLMYSIYRFNKMNWKDNFKKEMLNKMVVTTYNNNEIYLIHDIEFKKNPTSSFHTETKKNPISYVEHFKKKYNIEITDTRQPLLVSRHLKTNEIIYLIPELCRATGLVKKQVEDEELIDSLTSLTNLKPEIRADKFINLFEAINNTFMCTHILKNWKLELQKGLKTIEGRVMPSELVKFGNLKLTETDINGCWTKEMRYSQFYKAVPLTEWYIICYSELCDVHKFVTKLIEKSKCINYNLHWPVILTTDERHVTSFTEKIKFIDENYEPQLIFIILPDKIVYSNEIEMMCLNQRSIPVHIELMKTLQVSNETTDYNLLTFKLLTKLNCKVGGIPWSLVIPFKNLMTIGFHIWRDAVNSTLYYGAFVATMDLCKNAEYYSCIFKHSNADELSFNLNISITKALEDFNYLNRVLPQTIVFYRVKSGTYNMELANKIEVDPLIDAMKTLYKNKKLPQFTYIMVNKCNNTRLFKKDEEYVNPLPGTIVDDFITFSDRRDFYLISKHEEQGSATTTYYNVIHNFGLTTDFIQLWTWKMTHLFYNSTGTVNSPAVCEYAQKLAKFSSKYMRNTAANGMRDKLYFL